MIFFLFLQIEWQTINTSYSDSLQKLNIHFTIPSHVLKYTIEDSIFYAHYETLLKVFEKDGNQLTGDYWQVKRPQDSSGIRDSVSLIIPKTSSYYDFKIVDLNGGEIFAVTEKIVPINYIGNIKWLITYDTLLLTFSIFNEKGKIDSIFFSFDDIEQSMRVEAGTYDSLLSFPIEDLPSDNYRVKFEMYSVRQKIDEIEMPLTITKAFYLDDRAWVFKIKQLVYIATPSEMDNLFDADKVKRDSLWHAFWKQYDPTPGTVYNEEEAEYFIRIEYCKRHFSRGDRGWRSDRAKIYVKYGSPDEIYSRPYEISSPPYEVWYYYRINRKFIFVDEYGFGEYILLNSQGSMI